MKIQWIVCLAGLGLTVLVADSAPSSFSVYHDKLILRATLRNPLNFEKSSGSIDGRAAQSFDLFLAPEMKALLPKLPTEAGIDAVDFSILNRLGIEKKSSEAIEFNCRTKCNVLALSV